MSAVAPKLARLTTKARRNVIGKAPRDLQEPFLSGRLEVDHGGFDQVARAVEFVLINVNPESVLRTPGENVAVDVAVGQLRALEQGDNFIQVRLKLVISGLLDAGGCGGFKPFGKIGIPEDAAAPPSRIGPRVGEFAAPVHFPIEKHRVHLPFRTHFLGTDAPA